MSVEIELLSPGREEQYEALLRSADSSLLYASLPYRRFLLSVLPRSGDRYLIAMEGGELAGALPAFVSYNPRAGNVLNSLPFYGSNGGITVAPRAGDPQAIRLALMEGFTSLARAERVVASTLISNPLEAGEEFYRAHAGATLTDQRTGQITPLPQAEGPDAAGERLMELFHQKARNSVRKAQKSGLSVRHSGRPEALAALHEIHRQNMAAAGGPAKPASAFQAIRENFQYDRDYRVYLAERGGEIVAALLVFFFHRTAEYYTPATAEEHRLLQPMSLLIYEAMKEACARRMLYWNWGGPGPSQPGIYNYKKRWGTVDRPYYYYTRVFDESVLRRSRSELLEQYPFFYVVPFGELKDEAP